MAMQSGPAIVASGEAKAANNPADQANASEPSTNSTPVPPDHVAEGRILEQSIPFGHQPEASEAMRAGRPSLPDRQLAGALEAK